MELIKLIGATLFAVFLMLISVVGALADDGELLVGQYGSGDIEALPTPTYDYSLYAKEVAANPGLVGTVAGGGQAGIVVTPERYSMTVTAGKVATEKFRITNLGQSDVRLSVTIQPSTDRKILEKTTLDGKTEIRDLVIQAASYSTNYREIEVAVNTDFALGTDEEDYYTVDILIDGDNVLRKTHSFTVTVQPPLEVSPFSILGLSVLDISPRSEVCRNDTITGEVVCTATGFLSNGIQLSVGVLLLIAIGVAIATWTLVAWNRRRRDVVRVEDELGDPVDEYGGGDEVYYADEDEEEEDDGYRL